MTRRKGEKSEDLDSQAGPVDGNQDTRRLECDGNIQVMIPERPLQK